VFLIKTSRHQNIKTSKPQDIKTPVTDPGVILGSDLREPQNLKTSNTQKLTTMMLAFQNSKPQNRKNSKPQNLKNSNTINVDKPQSSSTPTASIFSTANYEAESRRNSLADPLYRRLTLVLLSLHPP